jgi:hypothetical protein
MDRLAYQSNITIEQVYKAKGGIEAFDAVLDLEDELQKYAPAVSLKEE